MSFELRKGIVAVAALALSHNAYGQEAVRPLSPNPIEQLDPPPPPQNTMASRHLEGVEALPQGLYECASADTLLIFRLPKDIMTAYDCPSGESIVLIRPAPAASEENKPETDEGITPDTTPLPEEP